MKKFEIKTSFTLPKNKLEEMHMKYMTELAVTNNLEIKFNSNNEITLTGNRKTINRLRNEFFKAADIEC